MTKQNGYLSVKGSRLIRLLQGFTLALILIPAVGGTAQSDTTRLADLLSTEGAEQGHAPAQRSLAWMYRQGEGTHKGAYVPQNYVEAVRWYRLAAEQGYAPAQLELGEMYYHGQGVAQDYFEAVRWYRMAAEQGYIPAHFNLGEMYYHGHGVPQDYVTSHMWYNLGAATGIKRALQGRDFVAQSLTPADISEAQRRARVCLASNYRNCD